MPDLPAQQLRNVMLSPAAQRQMTDEQHNGLEAQGVELQALRNALAAQHQAAEEQGAALREQRERNAALLGSTSWRLTAPLRSLVRAARTPAASIRALLAIIGKIRTLIARDGLRFTLRRSVRLISQRGFRETVTRLRAANLPSASFALDFGRGESLLNHEGALIAVKPPAIDRALALPLSYAPTIKKMPRVGIIVHIFYEDLATEIVGYLKNIPSAADLFASTDTEEKRDAILAAFSGWTAGTVEVRVMPNRGRDIAPKIVGFRDVYEKYEYILHLHSKKSPHASDLVGWRDYIYGTLLGSSELVSGIFEAFQRDPRLGIVAPVHWTPIEPFINWGHDYSIARVLAERMNIDLARDQPLDFPSGSMFWARTAALRPLLDIGLCLDDFPEEAAQIDGTMAHAIERLFFRVCERSGHTWRTIIGADPITKGNHAVRVSSPGELDDWLRAPVMLGDPALRSTVAAEARRTNFAFAPLRFIPDPDERPRLTLLIPSYHRSAVFGGIATAMELFKRIASAAGEIETRVVVTSDERVLRNEDVLQGYSLVPSAAPARPPRHSFMLCPPSSRLESGITIRRNDVLLASAWWDAANALTLIDQQRAFFGSAPRLGYFVQDYEPNFNAWSTNWALAEDTYRRPDTVLAMINSESLAAYLDTMGYHFPAREVFQPIFNAALSPPADAEARNVGRRKVVLVYWRPSVQRNLSEQALAGLARWLEADPISNRDWEIWGVGEAGPDVTICPGHRLRNLGKLTMQEYDRVLRIAQIGLSLMLSPHPSYPPLEMAAYGMVVVTNRYAAKDLSRYGSGFECTDGVASAEIGAALARAAARWARTAGPGAGLDITRAFATEAEIDAMAQRVAVKLFASG